MHQPDDRVTSMPWKLRSFNKRSGPVPRRRLAKHLKSHKFRRSKNLLKWYARWPTIPELDDEHQRLRQDPRRGQEVLEATTHVDHVEVQHGSSFSVDAGNAASKVTLGTGARIGCASWIRTVPLRQDTRARNKRLSTLGRPTNLPRVGKR